MFNDSNKVLSQDPQNDCVVQNRIAFVEKPEQNAVGIITLYTCPNDAHLHFTAKVDSRESQGQARFFPHKQMHATHKEAVRAYQSALRLTVERGFKIVHFCTERNFG